MTRKQAREEAFILVFEKEFNDSSVQEILDTAAEVRDLVPDDYINTVFAGVYGVSCRSLYGLFSLGL